MADDKSHIHGGFTTAECNPFFRSRLTLITVISIAGVVPLGFLFKHYSGPWHQWFNNYGAGLLYEVFWCLLIFLFFPGKRAILRIIVWVFVATATLEVLQLWHPPFLEYLRSYYPGRVLLGTSFGWLDFPHYVVGCGLAYAWMKSILKWSESGQERVSKC